MKSRYALCFVLVVFTSNQLDSTSEEGQNFVCYRCYPYLRTKQRCRVYASLNIRVSVLLFHDNIFYQWLKQRQGRKDFITLITTRLCSQEDSEENKEKQGVYASSIHSEVFLWLRGDLCLYSKNKFSRYWNAIGKKSIERRNMVHYVQVKTEVTKLQKSSFIAAVTTILSQHETCILASLTVK